ncbi:MAG: LPXTG cell wall anchor domain-containing protein [Bryobacteraceae bacterium]
MTAKIGRILTGLCTTAMVFTAVSATINAQEMPKTTSEQMRGEASVKTEQLSGTVVAVEGNDLLVRMSSGGFRNFMVPESRVFSIDGQDVSVHDLKTGTKLNATVTTTTTPVTERTTTVGTGKVWYVSGNTVILTLPNNENRMYKVNDNYRFNVHGQPASVHDLRKGMVISAQKIVEEPRTEVAANTTVTGHAPPPPKPVVAEAPAPARPEPTPAAAAPAPTPAPAPAEVAESKLPAKLPKTGSELPLAGIFGLLFMGAALLVRKVRLS